MDTERLKENFAQVARHGDQLALFFYSDLFLRHPELREMFPVAMAGQRDHLVRATAKIVSDVGHLDRLTSYLQELGRDHRNFGALPAHYEPLGASLLATLAYFSGEGWTPQLAADWEEAYGLALLLDRQRAPRRAEGLYDLPDLEKLGAQAPWLTVTTCVSDDPVYRGERGSLPDVHSAVAGQVGGGPVSRPETPPGSDDAAPQT